MDIFKETDFLYELDDRCGVIALSIDGNSPFYILFKQSIKIELTSHDSDGKDDSKVMIMQAPLESGQAPLVKSVPWQNSVHTCLAESQLTQALSIQDIDKLVKEKMAVVKEQKLERAIDRVKQKAVKRAGSSKASSAKQNHNKAPTKRNSAGTPKTVKGKRNEKLESNCKASLSDKLNEAAESAESGSSRDGKASMSIKLEHDTSLFDKGDKEDSDCDMSEEDQKASSTEPGQSEVIDCKHCFRTFNTRLEFFNHRRPKTEPQQCAMCKKVFIFRAYLLAHMRQHHPIDGRPVGVLDVCDVCGLKLKNFNRLKKHMLIHTEEYHYKCCLCGKNLGGFGALNTHMASHKKGGIVKCTCCDQFFTSRSELSKHQLALLEIKCHICGEVLPNRTSRTVHYQTMHPDSILTCSICNRMFSSDEELSTHMVYHTKYKKKQCTVCGKFVSRLERHILTHKSMKDVDESELFMCDKCPMKFKIKASLQGHQRTHSQERPYKCSQCPKSFAHQGVLLKHIRTHSPILPYKCDVCGKRCKEKSNLTVHMRIHSSSKVFPCLFCTQAFSYKSSLESHMKSKHASANIELTTPKAELGTGDMSFE